MSYLLCIKKLESSHSFARRACLQALANSGTELTKLSFTRIQMMRRLRYLVRGRSPAASDWLQRVSSQARQPRRTLRPRARPRASSRRAAASNVPTIERETTGVNQKVRMVGSLKGESGMHMSATLVALRILGVGTANSPSPPPVLPLPSTLYTVHS